MTVSRWRLVILWTVTLAFGLVTGRAVEKGYITETQAMHAVEVERLHKQMQKDQSNYKRASEAIVGFYEGAMRRYKAAEAEAHMLYAFPIHCDISVGSDEYLYLGCAKNHELNVVSKYRCKQF